MNNNKYKTKIIEKINHYYSLYSEDQMKYWEILVALDQLEPLVEKCNDRNSYNKLSRTIKDHIDHFVKKND